MQAIKLGPSPHPWSPIREVWEGEVAIRFDVFEGHNCYRGMKGKPGVDILGKREEVNRLAPMPFVRFYALQSVFQQSFLEGASRSCLD